MPRFECTKNQKISLLPNDFLSQLSTFQKPKQGKYEY